MDRLKEKMEQSMRFGVLEVGGQFKILKRIVYNSEITKTQR